MSDFDKSIISLVSRFNHTSYLGTTGEEDANEEIALEGEKAVTELSDYFNYYPQTFEVLEELVTQIPKIAPVGTTKRTLRLYSGTKSYEEPIAQNVFFIGNPEFSDGEWLVVDLTLSANPNLTALETFAQANADFNGIIVVEIN